MKVYKILDKQSVVTDVPGKRRDVYLSGHTLDRIYTEWEPGATQMVRNYGNFFQPALELCTNGCIHWYYSKLQMALWHRKHLNYNNPVVFEAETAGRTIMDAMKGGSEGLVILGTPTSLGDYRVNLWSLIVLPFVIEYYYNTHDDAALYCKEFHDTPRALSLISDGKVRQMPAVDRLKYTMDKLERIPTDPLTLLDCCREGPLWYVADNFRYMCGHADVFFDYAATTSLPVVNLLVDTLQEKLNYYTGILPNTKNFWADVYNETDRIIAVQKKLRESV